MTLTPQERAEPRIGITQTILVGDGSGKRGNCLQAAVASWFLFKNGFDPGVPDFANFEPLDDDISEEHYRTLVAPWESVMGPIALEAAK